MSADPSPPLPGGSPWVAQNHGGAVGALVTGILGIVLVPGVGIVAWILGSIALKEIDANPQAWANRDHAVVGRILGIVGTVIFGVLVLLLGSIFLLGLISFIGVLSST